MISDLQFASQRALRFAAQKYAMAVTRLEAAMVASNGPVHECADNAAYAWLELIRASHEFERCRDKGEL